MILFPNPCNLDTLTVDGSEATVVSMALTVVAYIAQI